MAEERTPEESKLDHLLERALKRELPAVLAQWVPSYLETEAQQAAGGSKLHYNHTFSPFGDDE